MTLTPSDVEQKTFSTALRGYNLDEVDDFLDEIVRTMRDLHKQLEDAKSAEPAPPTIVETPATVPLPPPPPTPIDESAVGKALVAAQETAERIMEQARADADQILEEARAEADTLSETRERKRNEVEQDIARLDGLVGRVKAELAVLSVSVGAGLEGMASTLEDAVGQLNGDESAPDVVDEAVAATGLYDADDEYEFEDDDQAEEADEGEDVADDDGDDGQVEDEVENDENGDQDDDDDDDDGDEVENDENGDQDDDDDDDDYFNFPADSDDPERD